MSNKKKIFFLLFLFVIGFCLIPTVAHAGDLFEIQPGDKSKEMFINELFNMDTIDTLSGSPLNGVIMAFNTCVLMLGGVLAAYTLITGTMSTAHEGEMLGKKWSAMWLPIRTTIASAFIFPVMGGFCVAQIIVIWLIQQGVGLANNLWGAYLDKMPVTNMVTTIGPNKQDVFDLASGILKSQYCSIVVTDYFKRQQDLSQINKNGDYYPKVGFYTDDIMSPASVGGKFNTLNFYYGFNDSNLTPDQRSIIPLYTKMSGAAADVCGRVSFNFSESSISKSSGDFSLTSLKNFGDAVANSKSSNFGKTLADDSKNVGQKSDAGTSEQLNSINKAKLKAVESMNEKLHKVALEFYNAEDKTKARELLYSSLNEVTKEYVEQSKAAAHTVFSNNPKTWSDISDVMKKDGWMLAGSWYMQLYRIQSLISNVAQEIPTYKGPGSYWLVARPFDADEIRTPMKVLETNMAIFSDNFKRQDTKNMLSQEYDKNRAREENIADSDLLKMLISAIKGQVTDGITASLEGFSQNSSDPIGLAYSLGSALETAIWAMLGVTVVGAAAVSGFMTAVSIYLSPLVSLMFIISNMLTVILPFMPFFLWLGAVLGWAVLCIEAVVAAPLWMMIHMHPDGDGVVGRGGAGYGMVLSLTVRPALMIIGLIAAITCVTIFARMVNDMFMTAFYTIVSRDGISILQIPVIFGTYAMALFIVIKKSFSLIHVIPDEVLKWLGVNTHNSVEKSAASGLQTMMAAKMLDEKAGQMNMGNAINAGKEVNRRKSENKANLDKSDAAEQSDHALRSAEDAAQNPDVAPASSTGKDKGMGDTIADQNKAADGVIDKFKNSPDKAMSPSDKQDLYDAYRVKAENAESLLASGAIPEGSAAYQAVEDVKQNAETAMQGLTGGSEGSNTGAPNTENSIDAAGASGRPSSSFDGAGNSNNAPDIPQTNVSPEGKIKKDE